MHTITSWILVALLALVAGCACPPSSSMPDASTDAAAAADDGATDDAAHAARVSCESTDVAPWTDVEACAEFDSMWSVAHECGPLACPYTGLGSVPRDVTENCSKLAQACALLGYCLDARAVLEECLACPSLGGGG